MMWLTDGHQLVSCYIIRIIIHQDNNPCVSLLAYLEGRMEKENWEVILKEDKKELPTGTVRT